MLRCLYGSNKVVIFFSKYQRMKVKKLYLHEPPTIQVYHSMTHCPDWIRKLQGHGKEYDDFLVRLIEKDFYKEEGRATIKKISEETGYKTTQATKWIRQIYDDIFTLNSESPELFRQEGIRLNLYFSYFDSHATVTLWLKHIPRVFDCFDFFFVKAKVGTSNFWVRDITHEVENDNHQINVQLCGGFPNMYREMLIEKALFFNVISLRDIYDNTDYQLDEILKKEYG